MALAGITIRAVQTLKPGQTIWDSGHREAVRGFGVRRQRDQATYVIKYRVFGRQRFFTIGPHGSPWTPEKARREAKRLLGLVADGKDPADTKAQASLQAADTLRRVADGYLAFAKQRQRPKTYGETERYLLMSWKPLHSTSVFTIQRRHISAHLAKLSDAHGAVTATRARSTLSTMFNWAIREGLDIPANPVTGTNRPADPKSRERVLTPDELRVVWRACGDDDHGRIVRLLLLTGQRRDEIGALRWSEIVGAPACSILLPPGRTKNHREHVVPLSPQALDLLPLRRNDRDLVFGLGPHGFAGWSKSKSVLDRRLAQTLPGWTLHDLRRTVATGMADQGVMPHIIEAVLNHVSGHRAGVAGTYNRARYSGEVREALTAWANHVDTLVAAPSIPPRPKSLRLVRVT
jgi:integrase